MVEGGSDPLNGLAGFLVLPNAHYCPTERIERLIVPPVSFDVRVELFTPPFGVIRGRCCVTRTAVPEASVHEHDHLPPGEYKISAAS